jgi:hypothetical protein
LVNNHKGHQQVQLLKENIDLFEYFINHSYIRGLVLKNHLLVKTGSTSTLATSVGVSTAREPVAGCKITTNTTASSTSWWFTSIRTSWEALNASLKPHL